jgi:tetratricopeptide (TPR) repeat protein
VVAGRWDDGEAVLRRYLALPAARWPQQRAAAWRRLARCQNAKGKTEDAIQCLHEGLRIAADMRDLWLDLADIYWEREEWHASYEAALRALAFKICPGEIANDHTHAGGRPYYRASIAAWRLGWLEDAHMLAVLSDERELSHTTYGRYLIVIGQSRS